MAGEMDDVLRFLFQYYSRRGIDKEEEETSMWHEGMTAAESRAAEAERARQKKERYAERATGLENMDIKELFVFAEEFGLTGSATHSNKASLVSNREVMRVARSVKSAAQLESDHRLSYPEFLTWMERLAIEAFKENSHGLETDLERVQHLLVYIDTSPVLADLRLSSGTTHKATFSLTHRIIPMQKQKAQLELGKAAATAELVERVQKFVQSDAEREHELNLIFEYYCSFGENAPRDRMKAQGLSKLCRDCDLFNETFTPQHLDIVSYSNTIRSLSCILG